MNGDKQIGSDDYYLYNSIPVFNGSDPTKANIGSNGYSFIGWNSSRQEEGGVKYVGKTEDLSLVRMTEDKIFYTVFQETKLKYTVHFYDGSTRISDYSDEIGTVPVYLGETHIKIGTDDNGYNNTNSVLYKFVGWHKEVDKSTADSSLLTTKIDSTNDGNPYIFYAAFEKIQFGADSAT